MKAAIVPILIAAVTPSNADDFAARWDAVTPPSIGIMAEMPMKPHAVRVIRARAQLAHHCHHVWYSHDHHRFWRCRR
jgi:hypothetical protein